MVAALAAAQETLPAVPRAETNLAPLLDIAFSPDDASFRIVIAGEHWVSSAEIRTFAAGKWQNLTKTAAVHTTGTDKLGFFSCVNVSWISAAPANLVLHTSLKKYAAIDAAVFVQELPAGAERTNASNPILPGGLRVMDPGNYPPIVAFPSLAAGRLETLGFVTWQSRMINVEYGTNVTAGPPGNNEPLIQGRGLQGLSTSGPVVLFDHAFKSLVGQCRSFQRHPSQLVCLAHEFLLLCHTVLGAVAPMDNFKTVVHTVRGGDAASPRVWETGVSSEVTSLPPDFQHRTLLVAGAGITATMDKFGQLLRKAYGTNHSRIFDRNIEYLSYWTECVVLSRIDQ